MAILTHPLPESGSKGSITPPTSIYLIAHLPWQKQIDSLIALGQYEDALSLVSSLDAADHHLSDAKEMFKRLRILAGLSMFVNKKQYDKAIDIFIEENVNPAKVVALFPKAISGKLYCDREDIEEAWGGRSRENYITQDSPRQRQTTVESTTSEAGDEHKAWRFSPAGKKKPEEDAASVKSKRSYLTTLKDAAREVTGSSDSARDSPKQAEDLSYKLSVDVLMRYLPDRRQQFLRALSSLPLRSRPTPSSPLPEKPSNSQEDLFAFPDAPLTEYKPEQLQRVAQVVETALFKCYLHAKPGLLGPLCRIENWCEVEEVEELLLEAHVSVTADREHRWS
jgi:tetratricopeptide (TPR) repeat protein